MDSDKKIYWGHLLVVLVYLVLVHAYLYFRPVGYLHFVSEDNFAESLSFLAWVVAAILLFNNARAADRPVWGRGFMALACLLIAMEEISWGQRFLGVKTPEAWSEVNFQEELNFHNLINPTDVYKIFEVVVLVGGVLIPLAGLLVERLPKLADRLGLPWIGPRTLPYFVGVWLANLGCNHLGWSAEVAELLLALAVVMMAHHDGCAPEGKAAKILVLLALGAALLAQGSSPYPYTLFREGVKFRELGYREPARKIFAHLNQDPQTATWLSRFSQAQLEQDEAAMEALGVEVQDSDNPHRLRFMSYVASALGRKERAGELRREILSQAQKTVESSKDPRLRAQAYTDLAMATRALGLEGSGEYWKAAKAEGLEPYETMGLRLMRRDDRRLLKWLGDL